MSGENRCAQPANDWHYSLWSAGRPRPAISNLRQRLNRKRVGKRPSCRLEGEAPEGFHSRTLPPLCPFLPMAHIAPVHTLRCRWPRPLMFTA
jgi:hypothetical protein